MRFSVQKQKIFLPLLIVALIGGGYFFLKYTQQQSLITQADLKHSYFLEATAKPIPPIPLESESGNPFVINDFKDQWSLLFFGFTHCPDVCPTELLFLKNVINKLPTTLTRPIVYFVSLDPKRDTPKILKNYVTFFNPNFKALRAEQTNLNDFIKPFGTYYGFIVQEGKDIITFKSSQTLPDEITDYAIDHTAWIYLINPKGKIHAGFPTPHNEQNMIADLTTFISSY